MGEGQWRLDDALAEQLEQLDEATERAVEAEDQEELTRALDALAALVRTGEPVADDHLGVSDAIVPPPDITLAEAHQLIHHDNLIPDLP